MVADYSKESRQVSALTLKMKLEIPDQVEQLPKRKKKDNVSAFGNLKALPTLSWRKRNRSLFTSLAGQTIMLQEAY